ncbi:serine hydrolase domain-containing protein [Chitinophaga sedimenti]|uniref:serine hydrolase domain-containing protein n=1 Tax=Chitinophaga sedimenti TaxID=2033606 RepID=UPI00249F719C|nr:serine hydrolase domain-containing protein [Chitinophaga sedimenti]
MQYDAQSDSLLIRAAYKDTLVFATGTKFQYCNLGYFMLADIIRQVTTGSFPDYMKKEVFEKNGLTRTQVTSLSDIIYGRAGGYVRIGDTVTNAVNYVALRPSGAFLSTIDDMLKWEMAMQKDKAQWQQMWQDRSLLIQPTPATALCIMVMGGMLRVIKQERRFPWRHIAGFQIDILPVSRRTYGGDCANEFGAG